MICSSRYDLRHRLFQRTVTIIITNGSGDEPVQPEGLPDFKVLPPSMFDLVPIPSIIWRSSRTQMFFKVSILKNFVIFTGKQLSWSLF